MKLSGMLAVASLFAALTFHPWIALGLVVVGLYAWGCEEKHEK
jgi:hypothetical protein